MLFVLSLCFSPKDSQEFLRCFMDHLHEELKQPVVVNEDDAADAEVDANNSSNEKTMKFPRRCVAASSAVDCDNTSEPSDTDYETCDSGLSSESNSVAADISPKADDQVDSLENDPKQLTVPVVEPSATSPNDTTDASASTAESGCTVTTCVDVDISSAPAGVVGDSISGDPCSGSEFPAAADTLCKRNSEAGAGEIGTVSTEESPVVVPSPVYSDCATSETSSLLSTSSECRSVQDSVAVSQTAEPTAVRDTHLPLNRKSSSRDRQPMESNAMTVDKPARPAQRSVDNTSQKLCKL